MRTVFQRSPRSDFHTGRSQDSRAQIFVRRQTKRLQALREHGSEDLQRYSAVRERLSGLRPRNGRKSLFVGWYGRTQTAERNACRQIEQLANRGTLPNGIVERK